MRKDGVRIPGAVERQIVYNCVDPSEAQMYCRKKLYHLVLHMLLLSSSPIRPMHDLRACDITHEHGVISSFIAGILAPPVVIFSINKRFGLARLNI